MVYIKEVSYVLDIWFWWFWPFWRFLTIFTCLRRKLAIEWSFMNRFWSSRAHSNRLGKLYKRYQHFLKNSKKWRFYDVICAKIDVFLEKALPTCYFLCDFDQWGLFWTVLKNSRRRFKNFWKFWKNDVIMTSFIPKMTSFFRKRAAKSSFINRFWSSRAHSNRLMIL